MMQSNSPYGRVSEPSVGSRFMHGAMQGLVSTGVMHAGFYGMSKINSTKPALQSMSRLGKEGLAHHGSLKRLAFAYGSAALIDGAIHSL
jgi:hypothetical protein